MRKCPRSYLERLSSSPIWPDSISWRICSSSRSASSKSLGGAWFFFAMDSHYRGNIGGCAFGCSNGVGGAFKLWARKRSFMQPQSPQVNVYGAGWCEDTQATREHLDHLG